jgi:hypothetical protein
MYTNNHDAFATLQEAVIFSSINDVPDTWKFLPKVRKVFSAF